MAIKTAEHIEAMAREWFTNRFGEKGIQTEIDDHSEAGTKNEVAPGKIVTGIATTIIDFDSRPIKPGVKFDPKAKRSTDGWPISCGRVDMEKYLAEKQRRGS